MAVLAAGGPGCAAPGSGIQAGEHVTVYVSMPLRGPQRAAGRDVADGARLALARANGRVGPLSVRAIYLDDTGGRGAAAGWSGAAAAANARRAAEDSTAIAYIGDFDSGASRSSLPVTNEARMLQVSPASAAVDLVQPYLDAGDQVPSDTQPTGERTFGRVIPSDEVQAEAGAGWAKRLGARRVAAVSDGFEFGDVLVEAFRAAIAQATHTATARADLLYYGGTADDLPLEVKRDLAPCPRQALMASDAMFASPLLGRASGPKAGCPAGGGGPAREVLLTAAAEDPAELPPSGRRMLREFQVRFRRDPGPYAAYGYEAMAVVLDAIRRAGDTGDDRDAVVNAFFDTRDRHSVLGTYSIDDVGDTTLDRLAGYRVRGGRPEFVTPLRAP
jgi:branched-chain amino acid transport system substrate-binding protein